MRRKMFIQCSNCGCHFDIAPAFGICEGMYYNGYRAVGDALYCPDCVKSWKERNGAELEEQYKNHAKMFVNWWNSKVRTFVEDKGKIQTYRINANGIYEEVTKDGE